MIGTVASVMTLLITVGLPNRPLMRRQRRLGAHLRRACLPGFPAARFPRRRYRRRRRAAPRDRSACRCPAHRAEKPAGAPARRAALSIADARADIRSADRCSPCVAPTARPAMAMPSISTKGSPSISMRSAKVPESPSSALQTMYLWSRLGARHGLPLDAGRESPRRRARAGPTPSLPRRSPRAPRRQRASGPRARRARDSRRATADR